MALRAVDTTILASPTVSMHIDYLRPLVIGADYVCTGEVLRVADIGRSGGTVVNEGLTRWTCRTDSGNTASGYGIAEYLHQVDDHGNPTVPVE